MPDLDWRTIRVRASRVPVGSQVPPGVWWSDPSQADIILKANREDYSWVYQDLVAYSRVGGWSTYEAEEDLVGLVVDTEPERNEFGVVSP